MRRRVCAALGVLAVGLVLELGLVLASGVARGHDGVVHDSAAEAAAHGAGDGRIAAAPAAAGAAPAPSAGLPFPVEIAPRFALTDHTGRAVTQADFAGRPMLVFFGYANCDSICSVALPRLAEALELMGPAGAGLAPVLITIDPARDTVAALGPALARWHPRLIGLTGPEAALAEARAAFQVEVSQVAEDPAGNPIYAHGSFLYLVGPEGRVLTLMPPILGPERIAEIVAGYL
ncbi:hypothetical protein LNKW23_44950 [Paralimibaculum aggregatum]|uniref:SCO family protein n=1 Tax=Paralimibaculum aggregatum TaxID=3036245 RepID=A0ABQ6LT67_9RHOB|nr:SCO family protein [Limibaculum sp. NKW23]GMG85277.1 hypothetical protein LNKW23_44950 [Limibaculum sp. NKW23]